MNRRGLPAVVAWLLLAALCVLIVARARYSSDLSAFLPRAPSPTQQLLVQQLQQGITSRLILVGIEGASAEERARLSHALAGQLRTQSDFLAVANGETASAARDQAFLLAHRYQLSAEVTPERFEVAGLRAAIADQISSLASPAGLLSESLFSRDPTGETLAILDQLQSTAAPRSVAGVWSSRDGTRALLIAETRASGSDTDAQTAALELIRRDFASASPSADARLLLSGPAVFAVAARTTIEREAMRLSILSTLVIVALLLVVYRSLPTLLLGLLPVASGALAGIAAVALGFGVVHGLTLGFGITLIGESVDYSIYLFVQSRGGGHAHAPGGVLWPTIALGMATSVCGFASLLPSSFVGLAQIGLYSISGLLAAAAVTRWVLPHLLPERLHLADLRPLGIRAAKLAARLRVPWGVLLLWALAALALLLARQGQLWNRDLEALSPVDPRAQALDAQMRADLSAPDVGNLVIVSGVDQQTVLERAQLAATRLDALVTTGVLGGYDSPTQYLPSLATQRARLAALPDETTLRRELSQVARDLPLSVDKLDPFIDDVRAARSAAPLTRASLQGTSFALAVDGLLWQDAGSWHALLSLQAANAGGDIDIGRVRAALAPLGANIVVLNVRQQTDALYAGYLAEAIRLSLYGFAAIIVLLFAVLRAPSRVLRVIAPLMLAVLTVAAALTLAGVHLTILHLIGLLLIVAVGSNYALFFDRRSADQDRASLPLTFASLLLANTCTVVGFGVLAFSQVPVLAALGTTVAPGTALALLFSAWLAPRGLLSQAGETS